MDSKSKREGILRKVQALLAKADSTDFGEERDALREKADNLMLKYAIEEAEIAARGGDTLRSKVVKSDPINVAGSDSPFREALADLLNAISRHARCRVVFYGLNNPVSWPVSARVVGMEGDVQYVDMLFTSLKVQLANELEPSYDHGKSLEDNVYIMRNAGLKWNRIEGKCGIGPNGPAMRAYAKACESRGEEPRKRVNPTTVKRTFVQGFVHEVSNRLRAIRERQEAQSSSSAALVPVNNAVGEAFREMFPNLGTSKSRQKGKMDWRSWDRGRSAGERADLGQTKVGNTPKIGRG